MPDHRNLKPYPRLRRIGGTSLLLGSLLLEGCLSPLAKHTAAFSAATIIVVNGSEDAYRAAIGLRRQEQIQAAIFAYDKSPSWSPYTDFVPLLTDTQLSARITVLDALKEYSATLVELTGMKSKDLGTAAAAAGTNLQTLNQSIATDLATTMPNAPVISTGEANGVSTAIVALGEFLTARKVKQSLPQVTRKMDPIVKVLCDLLANDVKILRRQADVDYQTLLTNDDQFIRHQPSITATERQQAVGEMINLATAQKANDALLAKLQSAIEKLYLTHHALAAAAQGDNPESLKQQLADLMAAGQDLGQYYKSLPTS